MSGLSCRFCGANVTRTFLDLGSSPLANSYVSPESAGEPDRFYPLHVSICDRCLLVQLPEFESPAEIFGDYAYFSSYSPSWVAHAQRYVEDMTERFGLRADSQVVEVASNDGYLLQFFRQGGIPVLGIEPAANVAEVAEASGIPTMVRFFGEELAGELADQGRRADLLLGNNVLAHVPDLNDFVRGLATLLAPEGVITMEFPHVLRMIEGNQFDTIYHEHFSYFSLGTVRRVFEAHGLRVFDVTELPTHGGSLRVFACHRDACGHDTVDSVERVLSAEAERSLDRVDGYAGFAASVEATRTALAAFLERLESEGHTIAGYGAPAKGNTLLNYCGIGPDVLPYTVDKNPHKQDTLLPGSRIPIFTPERIFETRPDYVFILPWNIRDEILGEMAPIAAWGGRFFVAIPEIQIAVPGSARFVPVRSL